MMNEDQRYLFDTFGYFIVPNVLTDLQVDQLRTTLRHPTEQWEPEDESTGPLHWDSIWRDLLDLPAISPILEQLIGDHGLMASRRPDADTREALPSYRLDHINIHTHVGKGFKGGMLHGGRGVNGTFGYHDGQFYNGLLTVSFELYDTHPNGGGFACIPGTHKSNIAMPRDWQDLSQGINDSVERVAAVPGDAIIFTEALTHGTLPWTSDAKRSTVFYKYSPHSSSWGARFFDPEEFRQYDDMDDRKLAILEPPNARYRGRPSQPRKISPDP
jgi:hypothetical protein